MDYKKLFQILWWLQWRLDWSWLFGWNICHFMLSTMPFHKGKYFFVYRPHIDSCILLLKVFGSLVEKKMNGKNYTKFDLAFDQTVIVTESYFPSPSLTKLLVELGGSLGLWLGVGFVQLCIYVASFISLERVFFLQDT